MLKGWQRSHLKSLGQKLNPLVQVGKDGLTDEIIKHIDETLEDHELLKVSLLKSSLVDAKEGANYVCEKVEADFIQAIGSKFVIYRQARDEKKRVLKVPTKK